MIHQVTSVPIAAKKVIRSIEEWQTSTPLNFAKAAAAGLHIHTMALATFRALSLALVSR